MNISTSQLPLDNSFAHQLCDNSVCKPEDIHQKLCYACQNAQNGTAPLLPARSMFMLAADPVGKAEAVRSSCLGALITPS